MDLIAYEKITKSEEAARAYVVEHCWPGGERMCPKCGGAKVYGLADGRYRCGGCKYTFHELSRRWINCGGLSCLEWLRLIKLFELELTVSRMVPQLSLSYNTVYKAVTAIRFALLAGALDARQLLSGAFGLDLGFENGKIVSEKSRERLATFPVFGLMEKSGLAFADILPHMSAESVFHFHTSFQLGLVRMGNVVYTDRYRHYDALILCGDETLPMGFLQPRDSRGKEPRAQVDARRGGFWHFAKTRLRRFNGVTPRRFPLYLKELEFRYNHRQQDIFPLIVQRLCALVPNYD